MLSCIWLFLTPWTEARQAPLSMGILQARILERVAYPFSSGSSQPRTQTGVSCIASGFFTSWATGKSKNTGVGSLSLLQRIFPTQESNWGLLHFRWILYHCTTWEALSPVGSLVKNLLSMQETWVWSLGWEDLLEKKKPTPVFRLQYGVAKSLTQLGTSTSRPMYYFYFPCHLCFSWNE